jgi:hypothetical protein
VVNSSVAGMPKFRQRFCLLKKTRHSGVQELLDENEGICFPPGEFEAYTRALKRRQLSV